MQPLDKHIKTELDDHIANIEKILNADFISIISPILYGLDVKVREALESIENKKPTLVIMHDTSGGIVEVVERIVTCVRHYYKEVFFIIPDRAMSAGTIFALSGDKIFMDYFSCLGPIDPQIEKEGTLVPALAYLNQLERLNKKSDAGQLTSAEYALLTKLDLAELYTFEQAKELSRELLIDWLSKYKFKNWEKTETKKTPVNDEIKKKRAEEIADKLSDNTRWHSHGRGIDMKTLVEDVKLKIDDYHSIEGLGKEVRAYFDLLKDYITRQNMFTFVQTREYF